MGLGQFETLVTFALFRNKDIDLKAQTWSTFVMSVAFYSRRRFAREISFGLVRIYDHKVAT